MVLELWPSDLLEYFQTRPATSNEIRTALHGPMAGLAFLHTQLQLVHCDVKPQNILCRADSSQAYRAVIGVLGDVGSIEEVLPSFHHHGFDNLW